MKCLFYILMILNSLNSFASKKDSCDWIFIYYAPYDNNLSQFSDSILNHLSSAGNYENIRVVFQVDKADTLGMYRYSISPNGIHSDTIHSEASTSKEQLTDYLSWVNANYKFNRSAVFFLDHGGGLDEVGQDLYPDSTFLKTTDMRSALNAFNEENRQKPDFIYLQVCAKSSIEPLYEFHEVANYTIACQKLLGAPNYYYRELIQYAHNYPEVATIEMCSSVALYDHRNMFESLTCIDNSKFECVKENFQNFVSKMEKRKALSFTQAPRHFDYANDRYWDLIDFLDCLDLNRKSERQARIVLKTSIQELIAFHYKSHQNNDAFSGISIAALSKARIHAYWHMQFYRDFNLDRLPIE